MVVSTHFLAGTAIGRLTGNPILALIVGFAFHFVMDLIPHWNYGYKHLKKFKTLILVLLDPFLAFVLFVAIGLLRGYSLSTWIAAFAGGFGCILPDLIEFIIRFFKIKPLAFYLRIHPALHWFDKYPEDIWSTNEDFDPYTKKRIFWGIASQVPFIIASIYFLIR